MNLQINGLFQGKATIIKGKEYLSAEAYTTPFINQMSKFTNEFIIQAQLPPQISLTETDDLNVEDIVFNRVWIQAVLPTELSFDNHKEVIGMVYGLDTRKPVAKIYRGGLNMACLNLCIFNPSFINVQELEPSKNIDLSTLKPLMEQTSDIAAWLHKLKEIQVPYDEQFINENLGSWVRHTLSSSYNTGIGKVKLATSAAIDAYKLLYEKKDSPYFIEKGKSTDMFNIYNAFTDIISNSDSRDIMNKAEKTILLREILSLS